MSEKERNLDEALDEIDRWSEPLVRELEGLSPDEVCAYFERVRSEFERELGRPLRVRLRRAPAQKKPA
jgi:hypothetical protein